MKRVLALVSGMLLGLGLAGSACAQTDSPVGLWKTIDDSTGKPKSLVRITEVKGEYSGRIEKLFREPGEEQDPRCDKCSDARKNQPITGMVILNGMKRDGDRYVGGQILDPATGKVYKSRMELDEDGRKLKVRGYVGVPTLGRTQTWVREQ